MKSFASLIVPTVLALHLGVSLVASTETKDLADAAADQDERNPRVLPLFSVVSFKNTDCTAVSSGSATGNTGKCYTAAECSSYSGDARGNCAVGFGVCCVITLAACGGTISRNSTYIANAGFVINTNTGVTSGPCEYTINYCSTDICQLRLDFQTFDLVASRTAASGDTFTSKGPTTSNPPYIQGLNTGRHMYIETSRSTTATTLTFAFTTADTSTSRQWNIRVDQIECGSVMQAPSGCSQWFTGVSGTITSYNWRTSSQQELRNQRMSACIRRGPGSCRIQYKQSTTSPNSFIVGATTANAETNSCGIGQVIIPRVIIGIGTNLGWGGFVCHTVFSNMDANVTPGTIEQTAPFIITHLTQNDVPASLAGFSLDYQQQGCTS